MERQFTATVYVIQNENVLLLFHPKHRKWLPPGGHLEANETPPECAHREVLEETGLSIELIKEEHIWIDQQNAISCERPYLCLIENIPEHNGTASHQHIDFIYLARPIGGTLHPCSSELRWFTLEEVRQLKPDEIFADTQEIVATIMKQTSLTHIL
jgi:ADP-ribose pyrophosphatase YjhB (NUDIX family)